ncbi:unnamed protein product [Prunus armeniaca]
MPQVISLSLCSLTATASFGVDALNRLAPPPWQLASAATWTQPPSILPESFLHRHRHLSSPTLSLHLSLSFSLFTPATVEATTKFHVADIKSGGQPLEFLMRRERKIASEMGERETRAEREGRGFQLQGERERERERVREKKRGFELQRWARGGWSRRGKSKFFLSVVTVVEN